MTDEADYPPWPTDPLPAKLERDWLHFYGPDGERGAVPVGGQANAWAIQANDGTTVTIAPSIHLVGFWHSPNPVTFRLVDELPDPKR